MERSVTRHADPVQKLCHSDARAKRDRRNLLPEQRHATHVATAALGCPAAQLYRAAAPPPSRESHGLRHDSCRRARYKSPHEGGRAALQRRVKLGKGTALAVPLKTQKDAGFSPEETRGPHPHSVPPRRHESALHPLPHKRKKEPDREGATAMPWPFLQHSI